jgi:3-oxoacyl-[acyl-carrier protein] reductase
MAFALAREGMPVLIADMLSQELEQARADASQEGLDIQIFCADLTKAEDRAALLAAAHTALGRIDVLINNAGIGSGIVRNGMVRKNFLVSPIPFWELDEAVLDRFFKVNGVAPYLLCAAVCGEMIERGWGRLINVTTGLDTMLRHGMAGYGGSKASLEAHTAIMAADLSGTGVTANVLIPGGPADTPMVPAESGFDRRLMVQPEQMGPPAVWLASDASDGITGQRFRAVAWNVSVGPEAAAAAAGGAAAWGASGSPTVWPGGDAR